MEPTTSVLIRDAGPGDLEAILALTNWAVRHSTALWSSEPETLAMRAAWLAERRAAGFPVLVAAAAGRFQGFASYGPFRARDGYRLTVEDSLYVVPEAQGRGVGRALLAALLEHARARGLHAMIGGIEAGNIASLRLHAALGFREVGRLPEVGRKFDRWLDLVLMQRLLDDG